MVARRLDVNRIALGKRIRDLRLCRNQSLEVVAEVLGVAPQNLRSIEDGLQQPRARSLEILADFLGVTLADIVGENEALHWSAGERIRIFRERRGLTQKALAASVPMHASTLCQIETGEIVPSQPVLEKLARALEVNPEDLAGPGK